MADLKRINRMVSILSMIDRGKHATPQVLADQYGVHIRSIFRDLEALSIDFPIYFDEAVNSYRFADGYSFRKINLSANEVRAILVSKAAVSKLGEGVVKAFDGLVKKFNAETGCKANQQLQSQGSQYWFDIDPVDDCSAVQKQLDAVQKAMDEKNSLDITYKAMSSQQVRSDVNSGHQTFYAARC
jgi:predicted DNA-binding transcriptional regulator YafY